MNKKKEESNSSRDSFTGKNSRLDQGQLPCFSNIRRRIIAAINPRLIEPNALCRCLLDPFFSSPFLSLPLNAKSISHNKSIRKVRLLPISAATSPDIYSFLFAAICVCCMRACARECIYIYMRSRVNMTLATFLTATAIPSFAFRQIKEYNVFLAARIPRQFERIIHDARK